MARYSVPFIASAAAGSALAWLRTTAAKDVRVWEIALFEDSTTASSVNFGLGRPAAVSNASGANNLVPQAEDSSTGTAAACYAATTATTKPTSPTSFMRRFSLPATLGAGIIWTFPNGLVIPSGPAELVIWSFAAATTTSFSGYFVYDE